MDDVVVAIRPTRWLSWDLGTFMEMLAARDVDAADAEAWFLGDG